VLTCQAWAAGRAGELPAAARLCVELGRLTSEVEVAYLADHAATTRRFRDDAVRAARTLGEPEVLLETLLAAGRCCLAQRELQRAADCFEEYRQLAATAAPAPGLQEALAGLAALYAGRAEYDRALARAEQRLELARADTSARAPRRLAEATEQLGGLLSLAGQTERAVEVLGERLKMASEPLERYAVLLPLAEATLRLGNPGAALSHLEEAETLARRHGRPSELATALFCLGRAQMHLGAPRQAQTLLREARATAQAAGQPLSAYDEREAELVGRLGDLALELGDQDQAMMLYEEQLRLAEADPRADIGLALANLALWNALRGDLAAADTHLRRFQDLRADHMRIDSVRRIGHLFLQLGNGGRALTMFREVLAHVRRGRHALEEAAALLDVGMTLRRAGEPRAALTHLRAALSRAQSRKERRIEALASWELGLIHAQGSEIGAAVSALQLGLDYLDAIEYPHSARDYQRNLALLKQLRQQLN
jgi:tetratricopeptide (TPR) repeat protein